MLHSNLFALLVIPIVLTALPVGGGSVGLGGDADGPILTPQGSAAAVAVVPDVIIGAWYSQNTAGLHHAVSDSLRGLSRFVLSAARHVPNAKVLLLVDKDVSF
jgi:hypothetical protein